MKKLGLIVAAVVFTGSGVFAQALKMHTDKKAKFSIQYPGKWKKVLNQGGVNAAFSTKDSLALVQVIRTDGEAGKTTDVALKEIEASIGEQYVNQLPEDKRKAAGEDLANMNAEEASAGFYVLDSDGKKINQFIMVARRGVAIYVVTVTYADGLGDKYRDLAIKSADSLKILK